MDLPWGDEKTKKFVTNVGLITSNGPYGQNIMAAEWTHHVSYSPGLIAICIRTDDATHENINQTKEFGINLCAYDQNIISSVSGGNTGKNIDKISALKELGFKFYNGKKIKCLMVEGSILNVECKVTKQMEIGDHTMFIGEVIDAAANSSKEPLVYTEGAYFKLGEPIEKPTAKELEKTSKIVKKFKK